MALIKVITAPIFSALSASVCTILSVRCASATARPVIVDDCATWRLISLIDAVSSSAAEATVLAPTLASSASRRDRGRPPLGLRVAAEDMDCAVALELGRPRRQQRHHCSRLGLEVANQAFETRARFSLTTRSAACSPSQSIGGGHGLLEDLHGESHAADLILAGGKRHLGLLVAGKPGHHLRKLRDRREQVAHEQQRRSCGQSQNDQNGRAGEQDAAEPVGFVLLGHGLRVAQGGIADLSSEACRARGGLAPLIHRYLGKGCR